MLCATIPHSDVLFVILGERTVTAFSIWLLIPIVAAKTIAGTIPQCQWHAWMPMNCH